MTEDIVIEIGTFNRHESCPVRPCNYIFEGYTHIENMFDFFDMFSIAMKYFYQYKHASPIHFKFYPSGLTQATVAVLDAFTLIQKHNDAVNDTFPHKLSIQIWDRDAQRYRQQSWGVE